MEMQTVFEKKNPGIFKYTPLRKSIRFEVVCANKSLHPFKQITTKPSALFNVRAESILSTCS